MKEVIRQIYTQAKLLGACPLFKGTEQTVEDIVRLFESSQGIEFCMKNHFPNMATFRLFKPHGVEKYGIYMGYAAFYAYAPNQNAATEIYNRVMANLEQYTGKN